MTPSGRIEWIYHLISGDPDLGASELEKLDRQWTISGQPEDRYSLARVLQELEDTQLVDGRARAWGLLAVAWSRLTRGETPQLAEMAAEALRLAQESGDESAKADAKCLLGDTFRASGNLVAAKAAYDEFQIIRRRLAERDPENTGLQRDLA
jgi:hypothetical protein